MKKKKDYESPNPKLKAKLEEYVSGLQNPAYQEHVRGLQRRKSIPIVEGPSNFVIARPDYYIPQSPNIRRRNSSPPSSPESKK